MGENEVWLRLFLTSIPDGGRGNNTEAYRKIIGRDDADWINLAQERNQFRSHVKTAMNLRITYKWATY